MPNSSLALVGKAAPGQERRMRNRLVHLCLATLLALFAAAVQIGLLAASAPAAPATIFNYPSVSAPCNTTLQACVSAANNTGDVVNVAAGTYITGQLVISHAITLQGAGPGTTGSSTILRPDGSHSVISVTSGLAAGVVISGLTVMSGTSVAGGAGIFADAGTPLTLVNVDVLSNTITGATSGGGVLASAAVTLTNVNFVNNEAQDGAGGGLRAGSTAVITGGRFERNTSLNSGGALRVSGALAMTDVTVISNTSTNGTGGDLGGNGGGVRADGGLTMLRGLLKANTAAIDGGGIYANSVIVHDATIFSNTAGSQGGAVAATGRLDISNSSITSNTASLIGGAVSAIGTATITGTSFANNRVTWNGASLGGAAWVTGTATVSGSTFLTNTASGFGSAGGGLGASGDITIIGGAFQGNQGGAGGAVRGLANVTATGTVITGNGTINDRAGGGIAALTATVTRVTMTGNQVCCTNASGGAISATLALISQSLFINNSAFISGSAVVANQVFVTSSQFLSNTGASEGGAIWTRGGSITGTQFIGNSTGCCSQHAGGALFSGGDLLVHNSQFTRNESDHGGAIFVQSNASEIHDSTFDGNFVSCCGGGGAIDAVGLAPSIFNSTFTNNFVTCCADGGAVRGSSALDIEGSRFTGNHVGSLGGGAVFIPEGILATSQITDSTFSGNSAAGNGGAVDAVHLNVFTSHFVSNTAGQGGGALFVNSGASSFAEVDDSTFDQNKLTSTSVCLPGGAIGADPNGSLTVLRSTFTNNQAGDGGAVQCGLNGCSINQSTFSGNAAFCLDSLTQSNIGAGGAVQTSGLLQVGRSSFSHNSAGAPGGGAIFIQPSINASLSITDSDRKSTR